MLPLIHIIVSAGPAVLPFEGGKEALRAQHAFVLAAKEAHLSEFTLPTKVLGVELRPTVVACKSDVICLTQIGATLGVSQIWHTRVANAQATTRVIHVADARIMRSIEVPLGSDPVRAYKDAVFHLFDVHKSGDLEVLGLPDEALVAIDNITQNPGKRWSATPGLHILKVTAPGFATWTREVFVRAGEVTSTRYASVDSEQPPLEPIATDPELVKIAKKKDAPASAPTAAPGTLLRLPGFRGHIER